MRSFSDDLITMRALLRRYAHLDDRIKQLEECQSSGSQYCSAQATSQQRKAGQKEPSELRQLDSQTIIQRAEAVHNRLEALRSRLLKLELEYKVPAESRAQRAADKPEQLHSSGSSTQIQQKLTQELLERGVGPFQFVRVPPDYYERDLDYRRQCLSAASTKHLCKSIIMENTKAPPSYTESNGYADSRYYCVIIQYAARLNADALKRYLHKLNGKLGIKNFNMRLAPAEVSDCLTSFTHNAVTPIGMRTRLPILLSHRTAELQPDWFWLGAGEVDLKVGMSAAQFIAAYKPHVIDCTHPDAPTTNSNCPSN